MFYIRVEYTRNDVKHVFDCNHFGTLEQGARYVARCLSNDDHSARLPPVSSWLQAIPGQQCTVWAGRHPIEVKYMNWKWSLWRTVVANWLYAFGAWVPQYKLSWGTTRIEVTRISVTTLPDPIEYEGQAA